VRYSGGAVVMLPPRAAMPTEALTQRAAFLMAARFLCVSEEPLRNNPRRGGVGWNERELTLRSACHLGRQDAPQVPLRPIFIGGDSIQRTIVPAPRTVARLPQPNLARRSPQPAARLFLRRRWGAVGPYPLAVDVLTFTARESRRWPSQHKVGSALFCGD
jgi:hypothetical protein